MKKYILIATAVLLHFSSNAREEQGFSSSTGQQTTTAGVGCAQSSSSAELDINNVRAFILNGGDMWWDQSGTGNARYEIPKLDDPDQVKKNSLFAGSVWIGGVQGSNVYVTAQTYRQSHYAYWPGPLVEDTTGATIPDISADDCSFWNKHFKVNREAIDEFKEDYKNGEIVIKGDIADEILNWPGKNNPFIEKASGSISVDFDRELAPFVDVSGPESIPDGDYNPLHGDYPAILGDQTIWWVMNDVGNQKEFGGNQEPLGGANGAEIGLELETRAFAFQTNDAVNDMTFYEQILKNKGNRTLTDTYIGQWVDPDLGNYVDDYVGCDVNRGLGIVYNGDDDDDGVLGYGLNPPALGVDFFEGPVADLNDGIDNDRDGITDEGSDGIDNNENGLTDEDDEREKIVMSNFLYYNNNFDPINGNPNNKLTFYNYLQNIWGNGDYVMYDGGDGTDQSVNLRADFMFPGTSDQEFYWGTNGTAVDPWDEVSAGNNPADRRFLQSAGPFTLEPGQVNKVTIGVVWCRAGSGGATGSLACLKAADDLAQELFDREFEDFNGPNPPDVAVTELDQEVILALTPADFVVNDVQMNTETYQELDKSCDCDDPFYRFQGYLVYQLKDETVSSGDLDNTDLARLVAQCDKQDGISSLVNYENDGGVGGNVAVEMVEGADNGVFHTLSIKNDLFNSGQQVVNNKEYYYMVLAYASNVDPGNVEREGDQFLGSKKKVERVVAIPHLNGLANGGLILNATYGTGIDVTSINGTGTGGNSIDYNEETVTSILAEDSVAEPTYEGGNAPIDIKVYDPYNVKPGTFKVKLYSRIVFDLNESDQFAEGDEITAVDAIVDDPSEHDYDRLAGLGYIYKFVDTTTLSVDTTLLQYIPEITEVQYNAGTNDTVTLITSADTIYDSTGTTIISVTPADTSMATFNIDTFYQAADTLEIEQTMTKNVVVAKVVVTNNNYFNELKDRGTFSKHYVDILNTFDPDANNGTGGFRPIFQGYSTLPLDFTSVDGSKSARVYNFELYDFFELEDENGNVLDEGFNYRVSEFNEVLLKGADGSDYGVTVQMKHGLDPEYEIYEVKGNAFKEATFDVTAGSDWLRTVDRSEDLNDPYWLAPAPQDAGIVPEYNTTDPTGVYTRIANGAIGPYQLAKVANKVSGEPASKGGPKYPIGGTRYNIENLPNIDVVIDYGNQDNWTRVPVLQADFREETTVDPNYFYNKSDVPSVGKNGQPDGGGTVGLGWFPGYAIDLDRGIRLNMMFSESKVSDPENGNNLVWEPTSDDDGGKSYVYILGTQYDGSNPDGVGDLMDSIEQAFYDVSFQFGKEYQRIFEDVSWVLNLKKASSQAVGAGNYKIRVRVDHTFRSNKSQNAIPEYMFSTDDYVPTVGTDAYRDSLCDNFRVVPNPYYAYSEYENGQLDNRVRLTNLPQQCTITILTLSGTKVKFFKKDDDSNFLDWNLLNENGSHVASGTYLIHIEADGICERVVKFFGVVRPLDLDTF